MRANLVVLALYVAASAYVLAGERPPLDTRLGELARGEARPSDAGRRPAARATPVARAPDVAPRRDGRPRFVLKEAVVATRSALVAAGNATRTEPPRARYEFAVAGEGVKLSGRVGCPPALVFDVFAGDDACVGLADGATFALAFDVELARAARIMATHALEFPVPAALRPLRAHRDLARVETTRLSVAPERAAEFVHAQALDLDPARLATIVAEEGFFADRDGVASHRQEAALRLDPGTGCLAVNGGRIEVRLRCEARALGESAGVVVVLRYVRAD